MRVVSKVIMMTTTTISTMIKAGMEEAAGVAGIRRMIRRRSATSP